MCKLWCGGPWVSGLGPNHQSRRQVWCTPSQLAAPETRCPVNTMFELYYFYLLNDVHNRSFEQNVSASLSVRENFITESEYVFLERALMLVSGCSWELFVLGRFVAGFPLRPGGKVELGRCFSTRLKAFWRWDLGIESYDSHTLITH